MYGRLSDGVCHAKKTRDLAKGSLYYHRWPTCNSWGMLRSAPRRQLRIGTQNLIEGIILMRFQSLLTVYCLSLCASSLLAADADKVKPIKALLVVGGCCHDYDHQKQILSEGISARANVEWDIVQQGGTATNSKIELYENPDWYKGYDVVVHGEC